MSHYLLHNLFQLQVKPRNHQQISHLQIQFHQLAASFLQTIDLVLKMESEEMLPPYNDAKAMFLADDNVNWPDKFTQEFGARKQVDTPVDGIEFVGEIFVTAQTRDRKSVVR